MAGSYREHHTAAATSHQLIIPMDMANSWSSTTPATRPMSEPPAAKKIFSAMVVSAPVLLYVSLLHVPPYSSLLGDTKFWFLVSNAIILVLAAEYSPMFDAAGADAAPAAAPAKAGVEEYYVKHCSVCPVDQDPPRSPPEEEELNTAAHAHRHLQLVPVTGPAAGDYKEEASSGKVIGRRPRRSTSELGARRRSHGGGRSTGKVALLLCKSKTEKMTSRVVVPEEEAPEISEYVAMSDEELNRRVEEFIRKFNMEIRRQDGMGDRRD